MELPRSFKIEGVPYFKSALYPYYCTEASLQMVYEFFCNKHGLDQDIIEDAGGRTYEGEKEYNDIGAARFFRSLGFSVIQVDNDDQKMKDGNADFFARIKENLYARKLPIIVRLLGMKTGWNHTIVAVGYDGNKLIFNDPDTKAGDRMVFPNDKFVLTSFLLVDRPEKCTMFQ